MALHSKASNWGWVSNTDMDRHLDTMNSSVNFKDRKAAFDNMQRTFYEQATTIKLGDYFSLRGWRSNVKNVQKILPARLLGCDGGVMRAAA